MNSEDIKDERVLAIRRKIGNEAFQLLYFALFISHFIKLFVLKTPFNQNVIEWILWISAGVYVIVRNFAEGVSPLALRGQKEIIIFSIVIGGFPALIIKFALDAFIYGPGNIVETAQPKWIFGVTFICGIVLSYIWLKSIYIGDKIFRDKIDIEDEKSNEIN